MQFDYSDWNEGEPNSAANGANCVEIFVPESSQWNDEGCEWTRIYVCKK